MTTKCRVDSTYEIGSNPVLYSLTTDYEQYLYLECIDDVIYTPSDNEWETITISLIDGTTLGIITNPIKKEMINKQRQQEFYNKNIKKKGHNDRRRKNPAIHK